MDKKFSEEDARTFLQSSYNQWADLNRDAGQLVLKTKLDNIYQRREFYKYITTLSLGILALTPLIADKMKIALYFYGGVIGFFAIIIFLTMRLREELDADSLEFEKLLKNKNVFDEAQEIDLRYLRLSTISETDMEKYFSESDKLRQEIAARNKERKVKKPDLDYSLEIVTSIFIFSLSLILYSINFHEQIPWYYLIASMVTVFAIPLTSTRRLMYPINKFYNYFRKNAEQ